jgi:prepilin-type processing-associated H-X9-DG protein
MDENLAGYLLDALEPDERRQVEAYLRTHPEARERLKQLRLALEPLAADLDPMEPPRDLWVRTLARVAEYRCQPLPAAPKMAALRTSVPSRNWWRRADVLVAASILLCLGLLIPSAISRVRYQYQVAACQNNLRIFHAALSDYSDRHHGDFPNVATAAPTPRNVAGMFVPLLHQDHLLPTEVTVTCPATGCQPPTSWSARDMVAMTLDEFERWAPTLGGSYAYSLGYDDATGHHGLRRDQPNQAFLPILADRPPLAVGQGDAGNSPNHGGRGQNVLYIDGHCAFRTTRTVGIDRDDIYLNYDRKVAAGKTPHDTVLAGSDARP